MNSNSTKISAAPRTRCQKRTAEAEEKKKEENMKQHKQSKFRARKTEGALPNSGMVTLIGRNDMIQNSKNPLKIKIEEEEEEVKPKVGRNETPEVGRNETPEKGRNETPEVGRNENETPNDEDEIERTEKDLRIKELEQELESLKQKSHQDAVSKLIVEVDADDREDDVPHGGERKMKDKPIFLAILEGKSKEEIQRLVESGEEWDVQNANGDTVLHIAATAGRPELIEYFISISDDPDVNAKNSSERTPLMEAAKSGKNFQQVFDVLVRYKADLETRDRLANNVLHIAIVAGRSAKEIEKIIRSTPNWSFQNSRTCELNTVLHVAAENGNLDVLKYLLSRGPDVNARNFMLETPLMTATATEQNFFAVVYLLLKNGADMTLYDKYGDNVLNYAIKNRRTSEDLEFLMTAGATWMTKWSDGKTGLHVSAEYGHVEAMRYFIGKGADLNAEDNNGMTPVMEAAQSGMYDAMNFLIENRAEFDASELMDLAVCGLDNEDKPLVAGEKLYKIIKSLSEDHGAILDDASRVKVFHAFVACGDLEAVRYFITNGADVNAKDSNGETPLMKAIERQTLEVFNLLMEKGADINAVDKNGLNVLHRVTSRRGFLYFKGESLELIEKLIKFGATWRNAVTGEESIVHAAVSGGRPEVVEYFISRGVDVNVKNWRGDTPLLYAAKESLNLRHFGKIMRILVNGSADPNAVDIGGNTALLIAIKVMLSGNRPCFKLPLLKLLVALGCDSRIPNEKGETVLSVLKDHGKFHLLKHFKSAV